MGISLIRWIARGWSIASIGLILIFILGEGINPTTGAEQIGLLFFSSGISVGMILGCWSEGIGGSLRLDACSHFA